MPDLQSRADVVGAVAALQEAGITDIAFYNYGHLRRNSLDWIAGGARRARRVDVQFKGKVVAVTGAAGGIGQELCRHFGGEGAAIAALDRSPAVTELCRRASQGRDRGRSRRGRHRRRGRREGGLRPDRGLPRPRRHPDQQRRRLEQSEPGRRPLRRGLPTTSTPTSMAPTIAATPCCPE